MKYKWVYGDIPEEIADAVAEEAYGIARYNVQEDYNRELIEEIANKTGHKTLAATCFVEVALSSTDALDVNIYTDDSIIEGMYSSKSTFHKSGGSWTSVSEHYGMSKYEFWERKENGEEGKKGYGIVDTEWLTDNFWYGKYYATNGWPLGNAEFLSVYTYNDVSAESVVDAYHKRYVASGRFNKYFAQAVASML